MDSDARRHAPGLTVAIIAAQPLVRAGIQMILQQDPAITVLDESTRVAGQPVTGQVDVQVVDDWLTLRRRGTGPPPAAAAASVAVVEDLDRPGLLSLLRSKVLCIVDRQGPTDDLLWAVHAAAHGAAFIAARFTSLLTGLASQPAGWPGGSRPLRLTGLTKRERQVLDLLCQGMPNQQIADALTISVKTAKFHVSNVLGKLGYRTRGQLIAAAGQWAAAHES